MHWWPSPSRVFSPDRACRRDDGKVYVYHVTDKAGVDLYFGKKQGETYKLEHHTQRQTTEGEFAPRAGLASDQRSLVQRARLQSRRHRVAVCRARFPAARDAAFIKDTIVVMAVDAAVLRRPCLHEDVTAGAPADPFDTQVENWMRTNYQSGYPFTARSYAYNWLDACNHGSTVDICGVDPGTNPLSNVDDLCYQYITYVELHVPRIRILFLSCSVTDGG